MADNGGTADEKELQEALRLSLEVDNDASNGTEFQSNSTTEVGGTQSRLSSVFGALRDEWKRGIGEIHDPILTF